MAERKDTSFRVSELRRIKLEKIAIEVSMKTGKITKISDIINYLLDNYADEAKKDLISKVSQ